MIYFLLIKDMDNLFSRVKISSLESNPEHTQRVAIEVLSIILKAGFEGSSVDADNQIDKLIGDLQGTMLVATTGSLADRAAPYKDVHLPVGQDLTLTISLVGAGTPPIYLNRQALEKLGASVNSDDVVWTMKTSKTNTSGYTDTGGDSD